MALFWTPEAIQDRETIYDHIEADNPIAALALDELFEEKAGRLIDHPDLGRPGRVTGTRELVAHQNFMLISDKVNIWREINADGAGLVAPATPGGTASLLQRWLALAPEARRQMAERARECFAQRFEMRRAVENLLAVIRLETRENLGRLHMHSKM